MRLTTKDHGAGVLVLIADHELIDERGRRVGGQAHIDPEGAQWSVRIIATRDGVGFGAIRRRTYHATRDAAVHDGARKLTRQGERYLALSAKPGSGWSLAPPAPPEPPRRLASEPVTVSVETVEIKPKEKP